jgi:mono/diheme cytochrome c family protein
VIALAGWPSAIGAAEPEIEPEALRPGLVATYAAKDGTKLVEVTRLEPTIAVALKAREAGHPRLSGDNGTIRWEGYLNILRPGAYRFRVALRGAFHLHIDGKEVLGAEGKDAAPVLRESEPINLEAGVHALTAEFTRPSGDARLELTWRSEHFRYEPLALDALGHVPNKAPARLEQDRRSDEGRFLAEEHNCAACHRPDEKNKPAKGLVARLGPDLSKVGERDFAGWIYHWLEAPQKVRPGTAMPQMFTDDEQGRIERQAVTAYLVSLGGPLKAPAEPKKPVNVAQGQRFFGSTGCLACHGEAKKGESDREPLFEPRPARFPLTGLGSKTTPERLFQYLLNPLAVDPSGRMPHMLLHGNEAEEIARYLCASRDEANRSELPPAPPKEQVFAVLKKLDAREEARLAFEKLEAPAQLVDLGKRVVIDKGCNNCHTIAPGGKPFASVYATPSFEDLGNSKNEGCLAADVSQRGKAPRFAFNEEQRKCLNVFLAEGSSGAGSRAPAFEARSAIRRFNCLACHTRDGEGGLSSELMEELKKYEKAENAEAVSPPTLTGIAHKLHTGTLRQVLVGANRVRPWMGLRMPQFGESNVGKLPEALAALEGVEPDDQVHKVGLTPEKIEAGKLLIGKGGLGCISCHDLAGVPNTGTRGPDLALTPQRVRYDWYMRWLEQPQRMQPGTRMPSVFSGGKSLLDQVLKGSADAQAEAMWAYLSLGPGMPLPEGMEPPKGLVLTVKDKPILLRTFMPDAGSRALAVGYPNGVSVAFDGATCRLAYGWSGNFLDASPVWNDRGGNPANVLGQRFWTAPPGCPWAVTYSNEAPDFRRQAADPAFGAPVPEGKLFDGPRQVRFDGYSMDKAGLPTFHYRVNAADPEPVRVTERPEPLRSPAGVGVARRFTLDVSAKQTAWLFAGETPREPRVLDGKGAVVQADWKSGLVELPAAGHWIVLPMDGDKAQALKATDAPEGSKWQLQLQDKKWQVTLRLPTAKEAGKVQADIHVWTLFRDEPALLKEVLSSK